MDTRKFKGGDGIINWGLFRKDRERISAKLIQRKGKKSKFASLCGPVQKYFSNKLILNTFIVMKVHFIAIGGSVMHQLAIALRRKGYHVTGSDDEIFEPARTNLAQEGLLPPAFGWFPEKIETGLDAVILGMH